MKLSNIMFGRTPGYYLFWTGCIYFFTGMYNIFVDRFVPLELLQVIWIATMALPFAFPPLGRWLNMNVTWDQRMFNFFGKKESKSNVVKFPTWDDVPPPEAKTPPMPEVKPPKEEPAKIYYRLGLTDNNRVAFSMGYSEITMNHEGCQQMIDQLTFFQSQLYDDGDGGGGGPDGGEPVPVPEQEVQVKGKKAA